MTPDLRQADPVDYSPTTVVGVAVLDEWPFGDVRTMRYVGTDHGPGSTMTHHYEIPLYPKPKLERDSLCLRTAH